MTLKSSAEELALIAQEIGAEVIHGLCAVVGSVEATFENGPVP